MSPAEKLRFEADNPRRQVITKTDIAKIENSWRQLPHEVSKGAQKNFDVYSKFVVTEWQNRPLQYNDEFFKVRRCPCDRVPRTGAIGSDPDRLVRRWLPRKHRHVHDCQAGAAHRRTRSWRRAECSVNLARYSRFHQRRLRSRKLSRVRCTRSPRPSRDWRTSPSGARRNWPGNAHSSRACGFCPNFPRNSYRRRRSWNARPTQSIPRASTQESPLPTEVVNYKSSSWRTLRDWGIQWNELTAREDQLCCSLPLLEEFQASDKRQRFSKFDGGWRQKGSDLCSRPCKIRFRSSTDGTVVASWWLGWLHRPRFGPTSDGELFATAVCLRRSQVDLRYERHFAAGNAAASRPCWARTNDQRIMSPLL